MFFDDQFFEHFLSTEKNGENAKKGASLPSTGGVRRSRGARRGGKEGKPLRDRWETELGLTRQHPGGVRRIEDASRDRRPSKVGAAGELCE